MAGEKMIQGKSEEKVFGGGDGSLLKLKESLSSISFKTEDESRIDIKLPLVGTIPYPVCGTIIKVTLWILLIVFQGLTLGWICLIVLFYLEPTSFVTFYLSPALGTCGAIEIMFNTVITVLGVIKLLQCHNYKFIHKSRILFNITIITFLFHLCIFFPLSLITMSQLKIRMEKDMERELSIKKHNGKRSKWYALDVIWERTQEKYKCCGFGRGEGDYNKFPPSCCPRGQKCNLDNIYTKNCYTADREIGSYYILMGNLLLGIAILFAFLLYVGFRYFRPYWTVKPERSRTSIDFSIASSIAPYPSEKSLRFNFDGLESETSIFTIPPQLSPSKNRKSSTSTREKRKWLMAASIIRALD